MRKNYNPRKLVAKRSYSTIELAEALGAHPQTIHDWRRNGMEPLPGSKSPYLFLGQDVRDFLKKEKANRKISMSEGEFLCLSCKKAVKPDPSKTIMKKRSKQLGGGNRAVYLENHCPKCNTRIIRFSSEEREESVARMPPKQPSNPVEPSTPKSSKKATEPMEGQRTLFDQF